MRTEYLLKKELDCVLAVLTPTNNLVIRTMLQTGLRVSDVLAIKPEQLNLHFWMTESKTGKRRQCGLTQNLLDELKQQSGKTWVFPSPKNPSRHRTRQAVWHDINRAAKAFRLPQNIGTHSIRKVYAVELMNKYGDIERVKRALKHRYESTTLIYAMADKLLEKKQKHAQNVLKRSRSAKKL
jgi:integrase